jgi:hypothetical protein
VSRDEPKRVVGGVVHHEVERGTVLTDGVRQGEDRGALATTLGLATVHSQELVDAPPVTVLLDDEEHGTNLGGAEDVERISASVHRELLSSTIVR